MSDRSIRLGSIDFINSLPVDLGIARGEVALDAEIVPGRPESLNLLITKGGLDVSPVSALCYAQSQKDLLLLPDLSISSQSGVQSVLLFSRYSFDELKDKTILVGGDGRTTPVLLEILCRFRHRFIPRIEQRELAPGADLPEDAGAMLVIGDQALLSRPQYEKKGLQVIDLAEEWRRWTSLPVVFAVWVARREYLESHPERVRAAHEALLKSKAWGLSHPAEVLKAAAEKAALDKETLEDYFSVLSYDLSDDHFEGMRLYFSYAVKAGLLAFPGQLEDIRSYRRKINSHVKTAVF